MNIFGNWSIAEASSKSVFHWIFAYSYFAFDNVFKLKKHGKIFQKRLLHLWIHELSYVLSKLFHYVKVVVVRLFLKYGLITCIQDSEGCREKATRGLKMKLNNLHWHCCETVHSTEYSKTSVAV